MFSKTTMELSTSMPTPRVRPAKVIRFSVRPEKYMAPRVMQSEVGMARAMISVLLKFARNRNRTMTASRMPSYSDSATLAMDSSMVSEELYASLILTELGIMPSISGNAARTLWTTPTVFEPLVLVTIRATEGLPLT